MALGIVLLIAVAGSSSADVTATAGSAFGARGSIALFGGVPFVLAPTPSVTLPLSGGIQVASAPSAVLQAGPARVVKIGALTVNTQGTTGPGGTVTSSATVADPAVAGFKATGATSNCTAAEAGSEGSTTIVAGTLATKRDASTGDPVTTVDIPADPPPNDTYNGTIDNVGDSFRAVFNEQVLTAGAITVNAVHFYLLGPTAVGDLFVGQSVCGVTAVAGSTTSTTTGTPTSTSTPSSTTTTSSPSTTSSTIATTSTTLPSTQTTTSTTLSSVPAAVGPTAPSGSTSDPGTGDGPATPTRSALARTGYGPGLTMLGALMIAIGILLLIGSGGGIVARHARNAAAWPAQRVGGRVRRATGRRGCP